MSINETDQKLYKEKFESLEEHKDKANQVTRDLVVKNISQMRNFFIHLITFSLIIMGAVLTVISNNNQNIFSDILFLYIGLILMTLVSIICIFYINIKLSEENNDLAKIIDFNFNFFNDSRDNLFECARSGKSFDEFLIQFEEFGKPYQEKEKSLYKEAKRDFISDIVSFMFIIGILSIGLSIVLK